MIWKRPPRVRQTQATLVGCLRGWRCPGVATGNHVLTEGPVGLKGTLLTQCPGQKGQWFLCHQILGTRGLISEGSFVQSGSGSRGTAAGCATRGQQWCDGEWLKAWGSISVSEFLHVT